MTRTRRLSQEDACEDFTFYPGAVRLQTPSQPDLAGSSQSRWLTHHLYDERGCELIVAELLPNAGYAGTVEIGSIRFLWAKPSGVLAKTPRSEGVSLRRALVLKLRSFLLEKPLEGNRKT